MKISTKWLKEILPGLIVNQKLYDVLTSLGLEVSKITKTYNDTIIDLDITPNRPDCLSVIGVARDLVSVYGKAIKEPKYIKLSKITKNSPIGKLNNQVCPKYTCLKIKNIDNHVITPKFITERLLSNEITSNNLIIDILNYVMLEIGQPLHAFDSAHINGKLNVTFSSSRKKFIGLDDKIYTLDKDIPIIVDSKETHAIAGVIGGKKSSVQKSTKDIIIESAYFHPDTIRKASKHYRQQTESSYRFERGTDKLSHEKSLGRVLELLKNYTSIENFSFYCHESKSDKTKKNITINTDEFYRILGEKIEKKKIISIFKRLNFMPTLKGENITIKVPSYRFDVSNEYDLIEEVARVIGYDSFKPQKLPSQYYHEYADDKQTRYSDLLVSRGYYETINFSFVQKDSQLLSSRESTIIKIANPISEDKSEMRTSLVYGLLETYKYNFSRQNSNIKIFENGRTYHKGNTTEIQTLCGLISGIDHDMNLKVNSRELSFYDMKGDLISIINNLNFITSSDNRLFDPKKQAAVWQDKQKIGYCGEISKDLYKKYSIKSPIFAFELSIDQIKHINSVNYEEISIFPKVKRDISIVIEDKIPAEDIIEVIKRKSFKYLINSKINDIFYSRDLGNNVKSLSLEFCFQDKMKTLQDQDINTQVQKIFELLSKEFDAKLRK